VVDTLGSVRIERALRPFWLHQVVEYLVGLVLISLAIQSPEPAVPAVLGLFVLINAAIARGPASAFDLLPRKVHRVADLVVIGLLVAAAFQPWFDVDGTGQLLLVLIAVVLFVVWFHTDFEDRAGRTARRAARARQSSEDRGRQAGRVVGDTVNSLKRWGRQMTADDESDES
jgi:cation transport ATPase